MKMYTLSLTTLAMLCLVTLSCKKKEDAKIDPPVPPPTVTTPDTPLDFTTSGLCAGEEATFYINRNVKTARWDFGDGSPGIYSGPGMYSHSYPVGTYEVTLIADEDSTNIVKKTITIKPCYDFSYMGGMVTGDTMHFTAIAHPSAGNTFSWDFGDGTTSSEANPYHIYSTKGYYTIKLEVNGDDANKVLKTIYIYKDPVYTNKVAGIRTFHDCTRVIRPVDAPAYATYLGDSVMGIAYLSRLRLRLDYYDYFFNQDNSVGNVIYYDKVFSNGDTKVNDIHPGTITYYIAEDSISIKNISPGMIKYGASGNYYDLTFTCHAP